MTSAAPTARISAPVDVVRDLVSLTKPRITFMVVLTTAGGLFLAPVSVPIWTVILTLVGTSLVVGAANTLNCWLERDVDKHMTRTKSRPLPAGRLDPRYGLLWGAALAAVSVPMLSLAANPLTGALAAVALVSYVFVYTPMKQKTPAALLVGAVPGALPPLMGWTAATGELGAPGWVLFGVLFFWQLPHFLAISVFRREEYTRAGIKVMPEVRGPRPTVRHAVFHAAALLLVSILLVPLGIAGPIYLVVALLLGGWYLGWTLVGFRHGPSERWAKKVFLVSLAYLPGLLLALAVDVAVFS